jgi:hypothetical protein
VVLPFVALSPLATLLLVLGPRSLVLISAGRALARAVFRRGLRLDHGLGAGTVAGHRAERTTGAALALTAGFGLGPVAAVVLAQWAPDPLLVPYLPHLMIGVVAAAMIWRTPEGTAAAASPAVGERRGWPPAAVRTWRFWLTVAPASPMVFGSVALVIVVLLEDVTSTRTLSAGFAGLMTALAFAAGVGVQPVARRLGNPLVGNVAGLCCAAVGTGIGAAAMAGADRLLAGSRPCPRAWPTGCAWCRACDRPSKWPRRASAARWWPAATRWPMWASRHRTWRPASASCQARPARSPSWPRSRS